MAGGAGGVAARLEDLDVLARCLLDAAADAAGLAARAVGAVGDPGFLSGAALDPLGVARVVGEAGDGAGALCRGAGTLAGLAAAVAAAVGAYRAREDSLAALARGVPLVVGSVLRGRATVGAVLLPGGPAAGLLLVAGAAAAGVGAAGAAGGRSDASVAAAAGGRWGPVPSGWVTSGRGRPAAVMATPVARAVLTVREAAVDAVVARPAVVDGVVRVLPGLLGVPDVAAAARAVTDLGSLAGADERGVSVRAVGPSAPCADPRAGTGRPGRAAGGVADLLRRGQTVAAWRAPRPGEHDSLPAGQPRPVAGQVRLDRVVGADGSVAWVVHVPGTQDWDADGDGSPMDMAANVALVGGRRTAVGDGVAAALVGAGARRGEPVLLVGHSQGGMTALALAGDPALRRAVTVTHVVTAGSPVAGGTPAPAAAVPPGAQVRAGVQVLALEHDDDLVPRLDGRSHPDSRDRVVVRAPAPAGPWLTDAVPAHSSSAYVVTGAAVDASVHPSLVAYRAGLAPFLDRDGASCSSSQVVLWRAPRRPGGPR